MKFSRKYGLCSIEFIEAKNLPCKLRVPYFLEYASAGFLEAEKFIETKDGTREPYSYPEVFSAILCAANFPTRNWKFAETKGVSFSIN